MIFIFTKKMELFKKYVNSSFENIWGTFLVF